MDAWLDFQSLGQQYPWVLYGLLFLTAMAENLFPPFPGDALVVFGGYLAGRGGLWWPLVLGASTAGGWLGFMALFLLARRAGRRWRVAQSPPRWLNPAHLRRVAGWLRRHGLWVVALGRFMAGVRAVISIAAGLAGLPTGPVAAVALGSVLAWNVLLVGAGFRLGADWGRVLEYLRVYQWAFAAGVLTIVLAWWVWHRRR